MWRGRENKREREREQTYPWVDVFDGEVLPPQVKDIVLLHVLFIQRLGGIKPPVSKCVCVC